MPLEAESVYWDVAAVRQAADTKLPQIAGECRLRDAESTFSELPPQILLRADGTGGKNLFNSNVS